AIPGLTALAILCWLYTWNEFLFALILTAHETPILTVVMAQFVHELGMEWHLMSATAVIALVPALIVTLFGQQYVVRGLRLCCDGPSRPDQRTQGIRARGRGQGYQPRHQGSRIRGAGGPFRLRQVDDAAHDRRSRGGQRRHHRYRRPRREPAAAEGPRH